MEENLKVLLDERKRLELRIERIKERLKENLATAREEYNVNLSSERPEAIRQKRMIEEIEQEYKNRAEEETKEIKNSIEAQNRKIILELRSIRDNLLVELNPLEKEDDANNKKLEEAEQQLKEAEARYNHEKVTLYRQGIFTQPDTTEVDEAREKVENLRQKGVELKDNINSKKERIDNISQFFGTIMVKDKSVEEIKNILFGNEVIEELEQQDTSSVANVEEQEQQEQTTVETVEEPEPQEQPIVETVEEQEPQEQSGEEFNTPFWQRVKEFTKPYAETENLDMDELDENPQLQQENVAQTIILPEPNKEEQKPQEQPIVEHAEEQKKAKQPKAAEQTTVQQPAKQPKAAEQTAPQQPELPTDKLAKEIYNLLDDDEKKYVANYGLNINTPEGFYKNSDKIFKLLGASKDEKTIIAKVKAMCERAYPEIVDKINRDKVDRLRINEIKMDVSTGKVIVSFNNGEHEVDLATTVNRKGEMVIPKPNRVYEDLEEDGIILDDNMDPYMVSAIVESVVTYIENNNLDRYVTPEYIDKFIDQYKETLASDEYSKMGKKNQPFDIKYLKTELDNPVKLGFRKFESVLKPYMRDASESAFVKISKNIDTRTIQEKIKDTWRNIKSKVLALPAKTTSRNNSEQNQDTNSSRFNEEEKNIISNAIEKRRPSWELTPEDKERMGKIAEEAKETAANTANRDIHMKLNNERNNSDGREDR